MDAIAGLMSEVRYCANCNSREVVNYWRHSETDGVVRYQCSACAKQTSDLVVSGLTITQHVEQMADVVDMEPDEYVDHFSDTFVRTGPNRILTLEAAWRNR